MVIAVDRGRLWSASGVTRITVVDRAKVRSRGCFDRRVAGREGFCPVVSDCFQEAKLCLLVNFICLFVICLYYCVCNVRLKRCSSMKMNDDGIQVVIFISSDRGA